MEVTQDDRTVSWLLNRPEQDNGLDIATLQAMEPSLSELEPQVQRHNCLLVGGGPMVFSPGPDGELLKTCFGNAEVFGDVVDHRNRVLNRLEALPLVSIACIEGACRLGERELALACDLMVAGESAMMSDGHLTYDAMPEDGATRRLPPGLAYSRSLRFIPQREPLTATEACKRGLVDEAVPKGQALFRGKAIAEDLSRLHPSVI